MRRSLVALTVLVTVLGAACNRPRAGSLEAAARTLGSADLTSIEFSGTGRWFQFGQSPAPDLPWPRFDVSGYTALINYAEPAARVQMTRLQTEEAGRARPVAVEQRVDQYVSGTTAWNLPPAPAAGAAPPAPQPQPAAVEERVMEIWTTPQGFLKAAAANNATSQATGDGSDVSFSIDDHRYVGTIDGANHVVRVQTWIDNPVLGDTPVEFTYSDYRDFGGITFPGRIVRTQGGFPVLELEVSSVTANPTAAIAVPDGAAAAAPVTTTVERLANGVYYIKGGTHHSVAIDQRDHIVVVEGPQHEERALAVIAAVKQAIPDKPIRYLINSHHHFDHSGGVRTFVDEGAIIVTHELNRPFYERAWAEPRTLNADRLAQSNTPATFETFGDRHVLTDGRRSIEVHHIAGNGHNDAFALVYLPAERILIEGDAFTPLAEGAAPPATVNPYALNLLENTERLKLDVRQIAALHGPRVATLADLRAFVGRGSTGPN